MNPPFRCQFKGGQGSLFLSSPVWPVSEAPLVQWPSYQTGFGLGAICFDTSLAEKIPGRVERPISFSLAKKVLRGYPVPQQKAQGRRLSPLTGETYTNSWHGLLIWFLLCKGDSFSATCLKMKIDPVRLLWLITLKSLEDLWKTLRCQYRGKQFVFKGPS